MLRGASPIPRGFSPVPRGFSPVPRGFSPVPRDFHPVPHVRSLAGMPSPLAAEWSLRSDIVFLNHGSYGAAPTAVLDKQATLRRRMERNPVQWFLRDFQALLDEAIATISRFIGADTSDVAMVRNATAGVNAVLRSIDLAPGDELVLTNHAYPACRRALEYVAARTGCSPVVVDVPLHAGPAEIVATLADAVTARTRLALVSHVTSPTGLVMPIGDITAAIEARGCDVLVDGAHAPGMVAVDVTAIGAAYYTGNCHKWMCAPKGAGFLHVRADRHDRIVPTSVSEGFDRSGEGRDRYQRLFSWTGTDDVTALLSVPAALTVMDGMVAGGWEAVMSANHALVTAGRSIVAEAVGAPDLPDEAMLGSMAVVPLPDDEGSTAPVDPLQEWLYAAHRIEVPLVRWPRPTSRLLRLSAQLYNDLADYEALAAALKERPL